jgi:hypothetical protein
MEIPNTLLLKYTLAVPSKKTELGELLKEFQEQINVSRIGGKYKPVTLAKIGMDVAHLVKPNNDYSDVYYLLSICKDAGKRAKKYEEGFSKMFYFSLRAK